ncbi:MAG TPA: ABC transporter ATP-binding protein [Gaiellales bacterium]|jgi:ATP-binding cassette subfamily B protein|nr:ABC transporter ATP-binding protein [Gaiellales bacterium]
MTVRRLFGFLRPYRGQVIVSALLAIGSQVAVLTIPYLTGRAIDATRAGHRDRSALMLDAALIVAAGALQGVLMFWRRFLAGRLSLAVEYDLRNAMYRHLQRLSFGFYDRHQTGQLMSRATVDLQSVRFFLGYGLIFFSQNLITVVIVIAALVAIDWQLALIAIAISPAMMVAAYRYSRISHPVLKDVQQRIADVTTHAEENIVGVRVVKAFAQEERETGRFAALAQRVFDQAVRAAAIQARYVPMLQSLPNLAIAAVLLVGGYGVIHGTLTLGSFFAVNGYLLLLVVPLRSVGMWVGQYQRAMASGERIFEVLDVDRDIVERPEARPLPDGPGQIRLEGVEFGYEPGRPVLRDVDLDVAAGSTVALIGPTGCGKTTLTALIPRFYDVGAGRVTVDGADVRDVKLDSLRADVGIVSQDTFLFSTTVAENIAYGTPAATPEEIVRAARQAQAHEFICDLPDGYETRVGERGLTLSGGQRQRIAIARALLMNPRILILDDATASVDATTEAKIKLALREVMKGRTTLIIAHRLSTISLAERVVVLEAGRIVAQGTHADLIEASDVYRQIHSHGLVDRTFVDMDGDAPVAERRAAAAAPRRLP